MLILTRRKNEQIMIGDNVTVTIDRIRGGQVRIGIDAPRSIVVTRGELLDDTRRHSRFQRGPRNPNGEQL